jgi:hypothetical protein
MGWSIAVACGLNQSGSKLVGATRKANNYKNALHNLYQRLFQLKQVLCTHNKEVDRLKHQEKACCCHHWQQHLSISMHIVFYHYCKKNGIKHDHQKWGEK